MKTARCLKGADGGHSAATQVRDHLLGRHRFLYNQFGDLERCALRPGNVHSADGWRGGSLEALYVATPSAGLLPTARLLLPRAIRKAGAGAWNGPPCDATGARFCIGASQPGP